MSSLRTNQTKVVKQKMVRLVKIPTFEDMCGILMVVATVIISKEYIVLKVPDTNLIFPCKSETSML